MATRKMVNVLAVATMVAAWGCLLLLLHPRPPRIDRRPHEALGEVLAAETERLLEPGARLIVLARDPEVFQVPAAAAQLESFQRALRKAGIRITTLRGFKVDPLRVTGVPAADFFELLQKCREDDVIVSFLGPPVLGEDRLTRLGAKRARILAVCSGAMPAQVDLQKLFQQKLLTAAIVSRPEAPARAAPGSKQSAFDEMFKLITPANVAGLPPPAMASQ
jgi:hypothetical protein